MTTALTKLHHRVISTLRNEGGATAVEYGLMVALIAVVIIAAVVLLGGRLNNVFENVANVV
jgi:pilus assembly protein Flp/PilA